MSLSPVTVWIRSPEPGLPLTGTGQSMAAAAAATTPWIHYLHHSTESSNPEHTVPDNPVC